MSEVAVGMGTEARSCHPGPLSLTQSFSLPFSASSMLTSYCKMTATSSETRTVFGMEWR